MMMIAQHGGVSLRQLKIKNQVNQRANIILRQVFRNSINARLMVMNGIISAAVAA